MYRLLSFVNHAKRTQRQLEPSCSRQTSLACVNWALVRQCCLFATASIASQGEAEQERLVHSLGIGAGQAGAAGQPQREPQQAELIADTLCRACCQAFQLLGLAYCGLRRAVLQPMGCPPAVQEPFTQHLYTRADQVQYADLPENLVLYVSPARQHARAPMGQPLAASALATL